MTQHTQSRGDHGHNYDTVTTGEANSSAEITFTAKGVAQIGLKLYYDTATEVLNNAPADMEQALNRLAEMLHSHGIEVAGIPVDHRDLSQRAADRVAQALDAHTAPTTHPADLSTAAEHLVDDLLLAGVMDDPLSLTQYHAAHTPADPHTAPPDAGQLGAIRACYRVLGRQVPSRFNPATFAAAQDLLEALQAEIAKRQAASDLHNVQFGPSGH